MQLVLKTIGIESRIYTERVYEAKDGLCHCEWSLGFYLKKLRNEGLIFKKKKLKHGKSRPIMLTDSLKRKKIFYR